MGARNDGTTTDVTGVGLYDLTTTIQPAILPSSARPCLTSTSRSGPNNGFISGNYSHCVSSGGSAGTGGSFSGGDIGAYPNGVGFGVAATLATTHYYKYSVERRISPGASGLKCQFRLDQRRWVANCKIGRATTRPTSTIHR